MACETMWQTGWDTYLILSSWSLMDSTAVLNSSEMSSLWASKRRMILSALSANHFRTAVKSYPLFSVCFSPARIPKVSPDPSFFCQESVLECSGTWCVKHVKTIKYRWPCSGTLKPDSKSYFSTVNDMKVWYLVKNDPPNCFNCVNGFLVSIAKTLPGIFPGSPFKCWGKYQIQ